MDSELLATLRADTVTDLESTGILAVLRGPSLGDTDLGGQSDTYADGGSYPVNLQENTEPVQSSDGGGSQESTFNYVAYLPWNANLGTAEVLRIEGIDYQVVGSNSHENNRFSLKVKLLLTD